MASPTNLDLLKIEVQGSFDRRGRIRNLYGVALASSDEGQALLIGADVPELLADKLIAAFDPGQISNDPEAPPAAVELCRAILEADGTALPLSANISYLFEKDTRFERDLDVDLKYSGTSDIDALRQLNPGNWHPVEWIELLEGKLGAWVMALEGPLVVSLCHTPAEPTMQAAECGVWTLPSFRGRGYATAVTSEWAALIRASHQYLFYSARIDNASSRGVARQLQLRHIGYTWRLGQRKQYGELVHPLSTLYQDGPTP